MSIVYPFLLECCNHTNDTYWKSIFKNLAFGKTPFGVMMIKDTLMCKYTGKEFMYKITKKDSLTTYNELYKIFTEKLGLISNEDKTNSINKLNPISEVTYKSWGEIKKRTTRDKLIEQFVLDNKSQYSLSLKTAQDLLELINHCIMFKVLSNSDFILENNKLVAIKDLTFSKKSFKLDRPIFLPIDKCGNTNIVFYKDNKLSSAWDKHIKGRFYY